MPQIILQHDFVISPKSDVMTTHMIRICVDHKISIQKFQ